MLPLTVLGIGLGLVGIGVAVSGVLSTILVASGIAVTVVAGALYLLGDKVPNAGGGPTTTIRDSGHGHLRHGNVITGSTVNIGVESRPADPPRRLLKETPEDLTAFFENHTDFQSHKLLEPYKGQWMQVTGRVRNVTANGSVVFEPVDEQARLFLWFDDLDYVNERVAILQRGREVTIQGQVHIVDADTVTLNNCELVDA